MFELNNLLRDNIRTLKPYSAARDEYKGKEGVFLDANENAFGSVTTEANNRYPDPLARAVKEKLASLKGVRPEQIFLGNGSDEAIDLLYRSFCRPGIDNVLITPPTYGMYEVNAQINDISILRIPLSNDFELQPENILEAVTPKTRIILICSPNNPTGNCPATADVEKIIRHFNGIVALDEAYIDFAPEKSFVPKLGTYPNLVVLQTFSKAWGMANLRLGIAFASEEIIAVLNKVKPPYNVNGVSQKLALEALENATKRDVFIKQILEERDYLLAELGRINCVKKIYPTDANFVLVKTTDARKVYDFLIEHKVIVRDRSSVALCENCLRITVGTRVENNALLASLAAYK